MKRSQSQPAFQQNNIEKHSQFNDSVRSGDSETFVPKYSPVKRKNPNEKYIPTQNFVNGEGTHMHKGGLLGEADGRTYQQILLD